MLRKTLITLTAVAALGAGSTAMAAMRGGMGAMHSSGMGAMHSSGMGAMHSSGMGAMHSGWRGPGMAPMHSGWRGPVGTFKGQPIARHAFFHNRFHRFHHRNAFFFAAGFAGPAYDSCWVWTYAGWRYVCGYPYGY